VSDRLVQAYPQLPLLPPRGKDAQVVKEHLDATRKLSADIGSKVNDHERHKLMGWLDSGIPMRQHTIVNNVWIDVVDAPITGRTRIVRNITFAHDHTPGAAVGMQLRLSTGFFVWGTYSLAVGSFTNHTCVIVLPAGVSLECIASSAGHDIDVMANYVEENEDSPEWTVHHDTSASLVGVPSWVPVVAAPPTDTQYIINCIAMYNASAGARDCHLAIQTAGPVNTQFHDTGLFAVADVVHYDAPIVLDSDASLVAIASAPSGIMGVVASYAIHRGVAS